MIINFDLDKDIQPVWHCCCKKHFTNAKANGKCAIGLFLDLSKAFNTIDLYNYAEKLKLYGIRGVVLKWFESDLSNRKQESFNGIISEKITIICDVPQGSILMVTLVFTVLWLLV